MAALSSVGPAEMLRDGTSVLDSLVPALASAFSVILVGFACVKLQIVKGAHKQGLSLFVTKLALPCMLFSGVSALNFSTVDWAFVVASAIGKIGVFVVAAGITLLLDVGQPSVLGTAGVHAIFVSQSNDFALGLPIIQALFQDTHPEYIGYLFLVAPISVTFLNPIGFLLMEMGMEKGEAADAERPLLVEDTIKEGEDEGEDEDDEDYHSVDEEDDDEAAAEARQPRIPAIMQAGWVGSGRRPAPRVATPYPRRKPSKMWKVVANVIKTPVVFMVPIGLVANFLFNHHLPPYLFGTFQTFANSFAALALFILGMSIGEQSEAANKGEATLGPTITALTLIAGKCLLLPLVIVVVLMYARADISLVMMGLIYGSLPCAPATFFYASEYGLCTEYMAMATVLGTFLFAPLVYFLAQLTLMVMSDYQHLLEQFEGIITDMGTLGAICAIWTLLALLLQRTRPRLQFSDHYKLESKLLCSVAIGWAATCIASLTCRLQITNKTIWAIQFIGTFGGRMAARIFLGLIALCEVCCSTLGPDAVHPKSTLVLLSGWALTAVVTGIPVLLTKSSPSRKTLMDCWYPYGRTQDLVAAVVMLSSASVIVVSICILIKKQVANSRARGEPVRWGSIRLNWRPDHDSHSNSAPHLTSHFPQQSDIVPSSRASAPISPRGRSAEGDVFEGIGQAVTEVDIAAESNVNPPTLAQRRNVGLPTSLLTKMDTARSSRPPAAPPKRHVASAWRFRTDEEEQNMLLVYCLIGLASMLVGSSYCLMPPDETKEGSGEISTKHLLLLLDVLLSYGQGAVLFLAFGLHPGLIQPIVALRDTWSKYRAPMEKHYTRWTDVLGGEVDDGGAGYRKLYRRASSAAVNAHRPATT